MTHLASSDIQLAQPADCAMVEACVRTAYQHYVERIGREPAPMQADYARLIALGEVYVLRAQNYTIQAVLVMRPEDNAMFIENIAVEPTHQRHGLGGRLMSFAEERAAAAGLLELRLYTNELMTENIAYYHRLGYQEIDRRLEDGFSRVFMHKSIK
jgi:ribosomal protein S18 acetylase RimI-like enzyme